VTLNADEYAKLKLACRGEVSGIKAVITGADNVALLEMTASETYDADDVQAVADKADAIIAALIAAGLMASS
jgi:hypothetical protein